MDGVLIDSEPHYNETVREMMSALGREYGEAEIAKVTGTSFTEFARILRLDIPEAEAQELYINALIEGVRRVTSLVPGIYDIISELLSAGYKTALGSSSPRVVVEYAVSKFGLKPFMNAVVTGSDDVRGKPAPDIFARCAELLSVPPEKCLVVEDSINGIAAGKAAGMTVCAFLGTKIHNFDLSQADFSVTHIAELAGHL